MKLASGTLVLVADGRKMLVFRNDGDTKYPVLTTVTHRQIDNPPTSDQGSDAAGRTFASTGERRSTYRETDWHQQAEDRFASDTAEALEKIASEEKGAIVIVSAPGSLGELRKHYGKAVQDRLIAEIDKDLTNHTNDEMLSVIAAYDASADR